MNFNNNYLKVNFENENDLLVSIWNTPEDMKDKDYRTLISRYCRLLETYKPKRIIIEASNSKFTISLETQSWVINKVFPLYKKYQLTRLAVVMSDDFIAQLSYEQIISEMSMDDLVIDYFVNMQAAKAWIISNKKPKS